MGFLFGTISFIIRNILKLTLLTGIFVAAVVLIPNLPPYTNFTNIEIEPTQPRVGPLAINGALNNARQLYKGKLLGPEAFQVYDGAVYTSVMTGEILKLSPGGHVTFVTKIGQPCANINQDYKCGRPLGFQIDEKSKKMYVADAYYGIWKVDLMNDRKQLLVSPRVEINGLAPKLFNDLALAKNGDIYWTDSSTDFHLNNGAYTSLVDPSGRLLHYNAAKNQSRIVVDSLWLANGVAISPDDQFVVVAESFRYRLIKYYIDGPKKGKTEVFVAGLPGTPDNIRPLPDDSGLLVSLYTSFTDDNPLIIKSLAATPPLRKFLARVMRIIHIGFEFLQQYITNPILDDIVFHIGHFKSMERLAPGISGFVHLDWNGNVVGSYYNTDGSLKAVSDVVYFDGKLYTGAPHLHDFVGVVSVPEALRKAFSFVKTTPTPSKTTETAKEVPQPKETKPLEKKTKVEQKKEAPKVKPVEEKPKTLDTGKLTPKPVEKREESPGAKPTQPPPKATTPKPSTAKPTTPPKQEEPKAQPKAAKSKEEKQPAKKRTDETKPKDKPIKDQIPIKEDIPSDTIKPVKEKLKIIKKSGPTEVPNPEL